MNRDGKNDKQLTPEQEREVIRKYEDPAVRTTDIFREYGIKSSTLYNLLGREHIPLRRPGKRHSAGVDVKLDQVLEAVTGTDAGMVRYLLSRVEFLEAENARLRSQLG